MRYTRINHDTSDEISCSSIKTENDITSNAESSCIESDDTNDREFVYIEECENDWAQYYKPDINWSLNYDTRSYLSLDGIECRKIENDDFDYTEDEYHIDLECLDQSESSSLGSTTSSESGYMNYNRFHTSSALDNLAAMAEYEEEVIIKTSDEKENYRN